MHPLSTPGRSHWAYNLISDAEGTCPPEDVGGVGGFQEFLEAMKDPQHPELRQMRRWYEQAFDPQAFKPSQVKFSNPRTRFRLAFG